MKALKIEDIYLALQTSLLGEIYPDIRAIVVGYNPTEKKVILRYYLDREPTEDDYESAKIVLSSAAAEFPIYAFDEEVEECIYSDLPGNELDPLDGMVYARKE